ncbi:MAG: methyltransferase domain-containing protein [Acidobacteriota bacterium]|nr:methyltransferase domain-containing protein [Acidobacteriota bacterium]
MLGRFLERKGESNQSREQGRSGPRFPRHSSGWSALRKRMQSEPGLRVIDAGGTSPTNINYLASLGHSIFMADLVGDAYESDWKTGVDDEDKPILNVEGYLEQTLNFSGRTFDIVLLWATLDYLPEPFVAAVVDRLFESMNPGGQVLAFFHTKAQGEQTAFCRFHLTEGDDVQLQVANPHPIQRAFSNRNIENLFGKWSGFRQFLAKDGVSEVIITR